MTGNTREKSWAWYLLLITLYLRTIVLILSTLILCVSGILEQIDPGRTPTAECVQAEKGYFFVSYTIIVLIAVPVVLIGGKVHSNTVVSNGAQLSECPTRTLRVGFSNKDVVFILIWTTTAVLIALALAACACLRSTLPRLVRVCPLASTLLVLIVQALPALFFSLLSKYIAVLVVLALCSNKAAMQRPFTSHHYRSNVAQLPFAIVFDSGWPRRVHKTLYTK